MQMFMGYMTPRKLLTTPQNDLQKPLNYTPTYPPTPKTYLTFPQVFPRFSLGFLGFPLRVAFISACHQDDFSEKIIGFKGGALWPKMIFSKKSS